MMAIELLPRPRERLSKYLSYRANEDIWPEQVCGIIKRVHWGSWKGDKNVWFGPFFFAGDDLEIPAMRERLQDAWTHFVLEKTNCQVYSMLNSIPSMKPPF
jgi:hypothetical protein